MERKVLKVGGNDKAIKIPACYVQSTHHLLDIDPTGNPHKLCDARKLQTISDNEYDSVYCSRNLEHYFSHDIPKVSGGFNHALKEDGFAFIVVPDIAVVMQRAVHEDLDVDDVLYESPPGPIAVKDVIYGFGRQIERSGCDFMRTRLVFTKVVTSSTDGLRLCVFLSFERRSGDLRHCVQEYTQR